MVTILHLPTGCTLSYTVDCYYDARVRVHISNPKHISNIININPILGNRLLDSSVNDLRTLYRIGFTGKLPPDATIYVYITFINSRT